MEIASIVQGTIFGLAGLGLGLVSLLVPKLREIATINAFALSFTSITYLNLDNPSIRWLGYTFACGFLGFETARTFRKQMFGAVVVGLLMATTLFSGFTSYYVLTLTAKIISIVFATINYILALVMLGKGVDWKNPFEWAHFLFFTFTWSIYPIVFLLGPVLLGVISEEMEYWFYFGLEYPAKLLVSIFNILIVYYATGDQKGSSKKY